MVMHKSNTSYLMPKVIGVRLKMNPRNAEKYELPDDFAGTEGIGQTFMREVEYRNPSKIDRNPLAVSLASVSVRGRDNHQRARCKAATGVDQSRERGCESLERDQGGRQPADSLDNVNDCRFVHGLSATAWLRRELAKRASVGSALPFAQAFTTGNEYASI